MVNDIESRIGTIKSLVACIEDTRHQSYVDHSLEEIAAQRVYQTVAGLVQIPCIERNAFAASRALSHNTYALLSDGRHYVSFDKVVQTMKFT